MRYLIRCTRHYYAGTIHNGRVSYGGTLAPEHGFGYDVPLRPFSTRHEAAAAISEIEEQPLLLGNGEMSRPTLTLVPESVWPVAVRGQVEG